MKDLRLFSGGVRERFERLLSGIEVLALMLIGLATAFAMAHEAARVVASRQVALTDLLLMFLYLEVLSMVSRYLKLGQLPVRFPLYIAMVSLARDLILRFDNVSEWHLLATTTGIVLLAAAVLILRYGQFRYPSGDDSARD